MKKATENPLETSVEVGQKWPQEEIRHRPMFRHMITGQNRNAKTDYKPFEHLAKFKKFVTILEHRNDAGDIMKSRSVAKHTYCHSVLTHLYYRISFKNIYINM
jgi:hypothetical protein